MWVEKAPNAILMWPGRMSAYQCTVLPQVGQKCAGDAGGDLISLAAYLFSISHREAARRLAGMLGLPGNIASRGQRLNSRPSTRMRSPALARCRVAPTKMLGN